MAQIKIAALSVSEVVSVHNVSQFTIMGGALGAEPIQISPDSLPSFEEVRGLIGLPAIPDEAALRRILENDRKLAEAGKLFVSTGTVRF